MAKRTMSLPSSKLKRPRKLDSRCLENMIFQERITSWHPCLLIKIPILLPLKTKMVVELHRCSPWLKVNAWMDPNTDPPILTSPHHSEALNYSLVKTIIPQQGWLLLRMNLMLRLTHLLSSLQTPTPHLTLHSSLLFRQLRFKPGIHPVFIVTPRPPWNLAGWLSTIFQSQRIISHQWVIIITVILPMLRISRIFFDTLTSIIQPADLSHHLLFLLPWIWKKVLMMPSLLQKWKMSKNPWKKGLTWRLMMRWRITIWKCQSNKR